jgi:hypothetical protein
MYGDLFQWNWGEKGIWLYILEVKSCLLLPWLMIIHKYVGNVHHIILLALFSKHLCWGKNVVKNSFETLKKSFEKIANDNQFAHLLST